MHSADVNEADRLLLAQADAALVLVDPGGGRVVRTNPVWSIWLGLDSQTPLPEVFWDAGLWLQAEVIRTWLTLAALPLSLPTLAVQARSANGQRLDLRLSAKAVTLDQRRHVLCTLVPASSGLERQGLHDGLALQAVVQTLMTVVEQHDPASVGHQHRVAHLAVALARKLGWPAEEVHSIEAAAWLHDLGMAGVAPAVLSKPSLLTSEEVRQIQQHVMDGVRMLEHIDFPGPVITLIAQHHERLNGSGYPAGLRGRAIARGAQVIGMADMLDAMTRDRPYQAAQSMDQALATVLAGAGLLFEMDLVEACVSLFVEDGYRFPDL